MQLSTFDRGLLFFIILISNSLKTNLAFANSLIFKSNFGPGVSITAPYSFSTNGAWQDLIGIDQETGYSWPIKSLNANFSGIQLITYDPINPDNVNNYIQNEIKTVVGPKGSLVRELFQTIKIKPVALGSSQAPLLIRRSHTSGDVTDLYISYWFKLQPDLINQLEESVSSGNWRSIFEFKTGGYKDTPYGDYRIQTTVIKRDGKLHWLTKADNVANGPFAPDDYWEVRNYTVPVPIDIWFKFEVAWHRSNDSSGRYWAAIDGQVLVDRFGPNMGLYNLPINRIFVDTTYSGGHPTVDSHITGLEIWSSFPCGAGISCFNASIAPKVNIPLLDQAWTESAPTNFVVPANTFVDPDGGAMTYSATLASGAALPSWLTFNSATRTFSGTPPKIVGNFNIRVIAKDNKAKTTYDDFNIKINNKPKLNLTLPDLIWTEKVLSSYSFSASTFSDVDGDLLNYSATLTSGSPLPSWLTFHSGTRSLTGTPPRGAANFNIRIMAKDPHGLSVFDDMIIKINNKPHVAAFVSDQKWNENKLTTYIIPATFFQDIDGDTLTYSANLSSGGVLPSWMSFVPSTRTFTGTPPRGIANYIIRIKATDPKGLSVTDDFSIKVNNKPHVSNFLVDQSWKEGIFASFAIPANTFTDIDGDLLSITATLATGGPLPSWLTFNTSTKVLSGIPPIGGGNITVRVRAQDSNYAFIFDDLIIGTP